MQLAIEHRNIVSRGIFLSAKLLSKINTFYWVSDNSRTGPYNGIVSYSGDECKEQYYSDCESRVTS